MIKSPEIKVNPDVLKALRKSSGYIIEEIEKNKTTAAERRLTLSATRRLEGEIECFCYTINKI
jgi:hypothetical protein